MIWSTFGMSSPLAATSVARRIPSVDFLKLSKFFNRCFCFKFACRAWTGSFNVAKRPLNAISRSVSERFFENTWVAKLQWWNCKTRSIYPLLSSINNTARHLCLCRSKSRPSAPQSTKQPWMSSIDRRPQMIFYQYQSLSSAYLSSI